MEAKEEYKIYLQNELKELKKNEEFYKEKIRYLREEQKKSFLPWTAQPVATYQIELDNTKEKIREIYRELTQLKQRGYSINA